MILYSRITRLPFREVLEKVTRNLEKYGLNVITTINLKDTLLQNLKIKFRNYVILEAMNPLLAYKAISLESHTGVWLPCNILVQEHENGETEVSAVNPEEAFNNIFETLQLRDVSRELVSNVRAAIDDLHREIPQKHTEALPTETKEAKIFNLIPS